jgi:DNA-binding transcriptional regulator YbjK
MTDAIDALTLGTINFLPKRIAEVTTNFTSATETERQQVLPRLQQILTARVSTSDLPIEFTDVIISM